jgi:hypothetical protein
MVVSQKVLLAKVSSARGFMEVPALPFESEIKEDEEDSSGIACTIVRTCVLGDQRSEARGCYKATGGTEQQHATA